MRLLSLDEGNIVHVLRASITDVAYGIAHDAHPACIDIVEMERNISKHAHGEA